MGLKIRVWSRRSLVILGSLVVGLLVFYGVENWRGKRAWRAWKAQRAALGESFDVKALIPPEVPEAENFAAVPWVAAAIDAKGEATRPKAPEFSDDTQYAGQWRKGQHSDLRAWEAHLGKGLETVLALQKPRLDALEEAAQRPHSRLLLDYRDPDVMPALLGFRQDIRILRTRAQVHLWKGRSEEALQDILLGYRVAGHFKQEPHLISQLLHLAMHGILMQAVWEGLQDRRWNEAQLARLQGVLGEVNLVASLKVGWMMERRHFYASIEETHRKSIDSLLFPDPPKRPVVGFLIRCYIPSGWMEQNVLRMDQRMAAEMVDVLDPQNRIVHVRPDLPWPSRSPYNFMLVATPMLKSQNIRMARSQSGLDQAVIACALERYRLAKKDLPETLEALVPTYLSKVPHDVVEGRALKYTRLGRDTYRLYALGWDGVDGGGSVEGKDGDPATGDWTWSTGK